MSGMECELCARPSGDDAPVCTSCAADCASALTQIHGDGRTHGLDVDLDIATARQDQLGDGNTGSKPTKPSEAPLPISPHASEAAAVLRSTLVGWVRIIHDELGGAWPADTLAGMARWLAPLCGWARHTAYAAELVDEILAAVHQARRAIDRPGRNAYLGQCPECGHPVYGSGRRPLAPCRTDGCDGQVDVQAWRGWMWHAKGDTLAGATRMSALLERLGLTVPASTIRMWAKRCRLEVAELDDRAQPLYRLGDVMELAAQRKAAFAHDQV